MKKSMHYTELAYIIRDFVLNDKISTLTIDGEIWNENDESRLFKVMVTKTSTEISALYSDESGEWPIGSW